VGAFDAARHVVAQRFPDALAAMLAGSAGTALNTATSNLDIVVFLGGPPAPFRETTSHAGWIVELFVHTPTSYPRFIERETNEHRSPLLHMCSLGQSGQYHSRNRSPSRCHGSSPAVVNGAPVHNPAPRHV
jgi:hypothetical protein